MSENRLNGLNPLAYMGVAPLSVAQLLYKKFDPTPTDASNFSIGAVWINTNTLSVWMLASLVGGVATWIKFAGSPGPIFTVLGGHDITVTIVGSTATVALNNAITLGDVSAITPGSPALTATTGDLVTINGNEYLGNTNTNTGSAFVVLRKSRGAGPIVSGDQMGIYLFAGYDGSAYVNTSQIVSTSSGTIAPGRVASDLSFYTHPDSIVASGLRMKIDSAGRVVIMSPDSNGLPLTIGNSPGVAGSSNVSFSCGSGDPNGVVTATQGSLYMRVDGSSTTTRAYINTNGITAWTSVTTAT